MTDRPTALSVVGWYAKGAGILGMIAALPYSLFGPDLLGDYWSGPLLRFGPVSLFIVTFLSSLACVLFGQGLLEGRSWARVAALIYCVVGTLTGAVVLWGHPLFAFNAITSVIFTAFLWFLLYKPEVSDYLGREA